MSDNSDLIDHINNLPSWATERTLDGILGILQKNIGISVEELRVLKESAKTAAQGSKDNAEAIKKMSSAVISNPDLKQLANEIRNSNNNRSIGGGIDDINDDFRSGLEAVANQGNKSSYAMSMFGGSLNLVSSGLQGFSKKLFGKDFDISGPFTALKAIIIGTTGLIAKAFIDQTNMYTELYKQGFLFKTAGDNAASSMQNLTQAAIFAGVPIKDFAETLRKYSRVISKEDMNTFANSARLFNKEGARFGLTASESADYLAEYMEQQRVSGTLKLMSDQQLRDGAAIQLKNTLDFARAMGVSADELRKKQEDLKTNVDFHSAMGAIPAQFREASGQVLKNLTAGFDAQGLSGFNNVLMKFVSLGDLALNDAAINTLNTSKEGSNLLKAFRDLSNRLKSGQINEAEAKLEGERIIGLMKDMSNMSSKQREVLNQMATIAGEHSAIQQLLMEADNAAMKRTTAQEDSYIQSITRMKNAGQILGDTFNRIVAGLWSNSKFIEAIEKILNNFTKSVDGAKFDGIINKMATGLSNFADYIPTLIVEIEKLIDWATTEAVPALKEFTTIVMAIGAKLKETFGDWVNINTEKTTTSSGKEQEKTTGFSMNWGSIFTDIGKYVGGFMLAKSALKAGATATMGALGSASSAAKTKETAQVLINAFKVGGEFLSKTLMGVFRSLPALLASSALLGKGIAGVAARAAPMLLNPVTAAATVGVVGGGYLGNKLDEKIGHGEYISRLFESDSEKRLKQIDEAIKAGDYAKAKQLQLEAGVKMPQVSSEKPKQQEQVINDNVNQQKQPEVNKEDKKEVDKKEQDLALMQKVLTSPLIKSNSELHNKLSDLENNNIDIISILNELLTVSRQIASNGKQSAWGAV